MGGEPCSGLCSGLSFGQETSYSTAGPKIAAALPLSRHGLGRAVLDPRPPKPRASFHAAMEAMEATATDMRDGLLDKRLVNKQRMDTVAFSVGGALFHAVALSCEQNSPVMRAKLEKVSNIYKQVIPMRSVGNLDDTSMYEVWLRVCCCDMHGPHACTYAPWCVGRRLIHACTPGAERCCESRQDVSDAALSEQQGAVLSNLVAHLPGVGG